MCIAFWFILPPSEQSPGKIRYMLLFNREEWFSRPTNPLETISRGDDLIVYGQDVLAKGTWLAVNVKSGMIAFLTNRGVKNRKGFMKSLRGYTQDLPYMAPFFRSRGQLIMDVISNKTRETYCSLTNQEYKMD